MNSIGFADINAGLQPTDYMAQNYLMGIDVSHWDGKIDWEKVKPNIAFAILKCTEGITFFDDTYNYNKSECERLGIPHGAYHFFRSNVEGAAQASYFKAHCGDNMSFLMGDHETNDGGNIVENTRLFLTSLQSLSGHVPRIYTAYYFWHDTYGNPAWASHYPLVVANYGVQSPLVPPPWTSWEIWQYSSKGSIPGINASVDLDYYNGTHEQLLAAFGNGEAPPPPPPPALPKIVKTTASTLYIRSQPYGNILGYCPYGSLFGVNGQKLDAYGKVWWQIGLAYIHSGWTEIVE